MTNTRPPESTSSYAMMVPFVVAAGARKALRAASPSVISFRLRLLVLVSRDAPLASQPRIARGRGGSGSEEVPHLAYYCGGKGRL